MGSPIVKKRLVKKVVKPLLLLGGGLLGLSLVLWAGASIVSNKQMAEMDAIATAFVQQHPKLQPTTQNDSARALEQLMGQLGFSNISGQHRSADAPIPPSDEQSAQLAKYEAIRSELLDYLAAQSQKIQGPIDPMPADLQAYLNDNSETILAIQNHLLTQALPVWDFDPDLAADFSYAMPNLLGLTSIQKLLSLKALNHAQKQQTGDMIAALEATLVLNDTVIQRPELISYLVSLIMMHNNLGVMRHLDGVPTSLSARLASIDQQQQAVDYLKVETWQSYRAMQKYARGGDDFFKDLGYDPALLLAVVSKTPLTNSYLSLTSMTTTRMMDSAYQQLSNFDICSAPVADIETQLGVSAPWWNIWSQLTAYGLVSQWQKGGRKALAAELTHHIVQAKALAAAQGQWPETLPDLNSTACAGETWKYEVSPEGQMSLSFSRDIDWLKPEGHLPLRYQAILAK